MNKTEAIKEFLNQQDNASPVAKLYTADMEVQVNVKPGKLIQKTNTVGRRFQTFINEQGETWKPFRIPWNAKENPTYTDSAVTFNLSTYAQAIGMTGWNWAEERSKWVGFDFDSITNHAKGLSNEELNQIYNRLTDIEWVTIYSSTSGAGYHIYVFLDNSPHIQNHTDHAAMARAILSKLSGICSFALNDKVDICGGILWVWKDQAKGFNLLKQGSKLDARTVYDWQDHRDAIRIRGKRATKLKKTSAWETLNSSAKRIELDEEHIQLLKWLDEKQKMHWWDADHWMLVCHTHDLKEAHTELKFKGIFETLATGRDSGVDQNCFAFPLSNGAWIVRRHSLGCEEARTWRTDRSGWTYTLYNRLLSIDIACHLFGIEDVRDSFNYKNLSDCLDTLRLMGIEVELHQAYHKRQATIKDVGHNKILVTFRADEDDSDIDGWFKKKKVWQRVFDLPTPDLEDFTVDHLVRHVIANDKDAGWYTSSNGSWIFEPKSNIADVLISKGIKSTTVTGLLGKSISEPWRLVNYPFREEYPGDRQWNKAAAQLIDARPGDHPHWDKILEHIGSALKCEEDEWCIENGITEGAIYLQLWLASLIQYPTEPLPYLFFYGPQNSGKSIFHEAFRLLVQNGVCRADIAITSPSHFNAEIEGAVLCVVEEINLQANKVAYEKIKDWVTSRTISIHRKGQTPYDVANTSHWVQCSNDAGYCPIFYGDTRILMCYVGEIVDPIPKHKLITSLEEEAPHFLDTLLTLELPDPVDRLRIPVIETDDKQMQAEINKSPLLVYIDGALHDVPGQSILFSDFCDRFRDWLSSGERAYWSNRRVVMHMPPSIIRGKMGEYNETYIANKSFNKEDATLEKLYYRKGRLIRGNNPV